jgi:hypothetical protein
MNRAPHRLPAVGLAALLCAGCSPREPLADRLERDLLLRQKEALQRELARSDEELDSDVVVVIPASLVDELLEVALPLETVVGRRFSVTVDSGRVDFTGGLALVRLSARIAAVDRDDVSARVVILGTLQVLDIQESGTLATRVEILGWQTQDVRVGSLSPPAGRLLDEFAARPASELNELLSRIEIPVQPRAEPAAARRRGGRSHDCRSRHPALRAAAGGARRRRHACGYTSTSP